MKKFHVHQPLKNLAVAAGLLLLAVRPASAHFLWAEIADAPKAGEAPSLRVALAEASGEANSGAPLARLNAAKVVGTAKPAPALKAGDGAMVAPLIAGQSVAAAQQNWGILDKTAEGRGVFQLYYYAKAATSIDAAATSQNLPLEFSLKREGAKLVATLTYDGKPVNGSAVKLHVPDVEKPVDLTSDAQGQVRFAAEKAGLFGLRGVYKDNKPGVFEEKDYDFTSNYSTLTFRVAASDVSAPAAAAPAAAAKPASTEAPVAAAVPVSLKADPAAYKLLKAANATRQTYPKDFAGLRAEVVFSDNGISHTGSVDYALDGEKNLTISGLSEEQGKWLKHQLFSMIVHRRNDSFESGNGRFPMTFAGPETTLGRLVQLNDGQNSLVRVQNNRVNEITRTMDKQRFTISLLSFVPTEGGKFVNGDYVVSYRDLNTGALQRVDGFHDVYKKIGGAWIPSLRRVVTSAADATEARTRTIELRSVKPFKAARVAAR